MQVAGAVLVLRGVTARDLVSWLVAQEGDRAPCRIGLVDQSSGPDCGETTHMAVTTSYAGREYPPNQAYEVGREKLREFAEVVGATHPAHHDVDAARALGYPDVIAPPTFAVVVAQRAEQQYIADPAAGIDFSRVVHADERFTHHRPIHAGDRLVTVLHVDAIVERAGLSMITTRAEISAEDGSAVVTVLSTLAVRAADPDVEAVA